MRVALINPNYLAQIYGESIEQNHPPMGLAYMAATLRQNGIDVSILDSNALDLESQEVRREIEQRMPDIVGITVPTSVVKEVEEIARITKEVAKDIIVIVGGPHPTVLPAEMLRNRDIDICAIGEGEYTLLELVKALEQGDSDLSTVKGIAYKRGSGIRINERRPLIPDIDTLPFPARDLLPMDKYRFPLPRGKRARWATILSSRGCPFNCIFCGQHNIFGRKARFRSAKNVVDEVEELINKYGINMFSFIDSDATLSKKNMMNICDEIMARQIDIEWTCGTRVDLVDLELLSKMREAGCRQINFGIESGNQKILDTLNKGITIEESKNAVEMAKKAGLKVYTYFMIGSPGETRKTVYDTISFARKLGGDYAQFSITTPFPGTELFETAEKMGKIKTHDWSKYVKYHTAVFETEELSSKELERLKAKAFRSFYIRPRYIVKKLLEIRSMTDIKKLWRGVLTLRGFLKSEH